MIARRRACCGTGLIPVVVLLAIGCTGTHAAGRADSYDRARSLLAEVENTPQLIETFHTDPRVLVAIGIFLQAADADRLTGDQMRERFDRLVPSPPWEWAPAIDIHRVGPRLYLVALSQAYDGTPSSLYLFDGSQYVKVDAARSSLIRVENVYRTGDRIEVIYFPTSSGTAPELTSAVLERAGTAWRVDRDTPYRRVTSLLARLSGDEIRDPHLFRNPRLLEAFGLFLESAGRLTDDELWQHMIALFPAGWHNAQPQFVIRRLGPALYLVLIASDRPDVANGSLYLFEGADHVTLVSDDMRSIVIENVRVSDRRVAVTCSRVAPSVPGQTESVIAEKQGEAWRVVSRTSAAAIDASRADLVVVEDTGRIARAPGASR